MILNLANLLCVVGHQKATAVKLTGHHLPGLDTPKTQNFIITRALFSSQKFCKIWIVPLSFVFDKYYPIMY